MAFQVSHGKLKTAFKKGRIIAPLYTGGPVSTSSDGRILATCIGEEAILTDLEEGRQIARFAGDGESITSLCISPSGLSLAIFSSSMSLRIYDLPKLTSGPSKTIAPKRVIARAHDAPVHVCTFDPTSTYLASGSADGIVKVWDVSRGFTTHVLRGHGGVVSALKFSYPISAGSVEEREMKLVTASVDTKVRVWNLSKTAAEMKKGKQVKPESILEGHVSVPRGVDISEDGKWLISGGRDAVVLVWDLTAGAKKERKGKEKAPSNPVLIKTVTVVERVEACGFLSEGAEISGGLSGKGDIRFFTAGEKGMVKVWNGRHGKELARFGEDIAPVASGSANAEEQEEQRQVVDALYVPNTNTIISVHADQNILFHSLSSSAVSRQLVGFNDEIIDAAFLNSPSATPSPSTSRDTHIALATNSSLIRLYSSHTLDARLLSGHTDIVLCLAASSGREVFSSGGKDRTARIWAPRSSSLSSPGDWGWGCVAICEGHAESVGALAFSRQGSTPGDETPKLKFMFTASQDRTIKMWDLSSTPTYTTPSQSPEKCKSLCTQKAHDKDINALDVSPNDALIASGSQDRTAKIFSIVYTMSSAGARGELKLLGTCKGHKRGVWSVRFAKGERVLATGSGDRTVRVWGLEDFSCLRVLEGHANSVLRVDWLLPTVDGRSHGQSPEQLVSSASDGLVKVWDTRQEECVATLDGHEDKVWALAISSDSRRIVSGAADSVVTFWEDCTQEVEEAREKEREEGVLKEQELQNYVAVNDYHRAISLALSLAHPGRLYNLFKNISSSEKDEDGMSIALNIPTTSATLTVTGADDQAPLDDSILGSKSVDDVIRTLHPSELGKLLKYVRDWNAKASSSAVAQKVLHAIVKLRSADEVINAFTPSPLDINDSAVAEDSDGPGATKAGKNNQTVDGKEVVEGLIAYTERHLKRMERLVQESYVLDFVVGEMDDGLLDDAVDGMDIDSDSGSDSDS